MDNAIPNKTLYFATFSETIKRRQAVFQRIWPKQDTLDGCEASIDMMIEHEMPALKAAGNEKRTLISGC